LEFAASYSGYWQVW